MCGSPKAPKVEKRDLRAEEEAAARKATLKANAESAYRKSRQKRNSLIANVGGAGGTTYGSAIGQPVGKDTLG